MNNEIIGYERIDKFNPEKLEKLQEHYAAILELLGEDVTREGLEKTPLRVAKSMQFLTQGYTMDPKEILLSAKFKEDYRQMVVVKDRPFQCQFIFSGQHIDGCIPVIQKCQKSDIFPVDGFCFSL